MTFTVVGPRVLVRPEALPDMTEDGKLHLIHNRQRSTMKGTVVALGDGPLSPKGVTLEHYVSVGDRVLFSPDSGEELIFEKDVFVCLNEDAILAVID